VTKTRRTLRTRLVLAMAGIAIGVVLITGVTTIGLARRGAAQTAQHQLEDKAPRVARQLEELGQRLRLRQERGASSRPLSRLLVSTLRISNAGLVTVTPDASAVLLSSMISPGMPSLSGSIFPRRTTSARDCGAVFL